MTTIDIQANTKEELSYEKQMLNATMSNSSAKNSNRKRPQTGSLNARAPTSSKD